MANASVAPAFPQLTEQERKAVHVVFLEDGRRVEVPSLLYEHIREAGFNHGVKWGRANPPPVKQATAG